MLALSNHLILDASQAGDNGTLRIVIAGSRDNADILDSVLLAAAYHPLTIPDSFDDNPDALRAELANRRIELDAPIPAAGLYGLARQVRTIDLQIDDPSRFDQALEQASS